MSSNKVGSHEQKLLGKGHKSLLKGGVKSQVNVKLAHQQIGTERVLLVKLADTLDSHFRFGPFLKEK